jgi:hypothetical protein
MSTGGSANRISNNSNLDINKHLGPVRSGHTGETTMQRVKRLLGN